MGALFGLILTFTLGNSPSGAATDSGSSQPQGGNGVGLPLDKRPSGVPIALSGQKSFVGGETGVCKVPIRDSYDRKEWWEHPVCIQLYHSDPDTWLVTIRNAGNVSVFLNEEYGPFWHGQTTILPKEIKLVPLWNAAVVRIGACWTGSGGPGTCQAGPPHQVADVHVERWVNATHFHELWFRETGSKEVPKVDGPVIAINNSDLPIQLHWKLLGPDKWVTIPPKGHSAEIPASTGRVIHARKDFGTGAAARVTFASTGGEDDSYTLINSGGGPGSPTYAEMTWLGGSWCSVHLKNLGSNSVILNTWYPPGTYPFAPQSGPGLSLQGHQSGTLTMKAGTIVITGHVGIGAPGQSTTLKATDWKKCS